MSRHDDPNDELIAYSDALEGGDLGEACARLSREFGDRDEPVTHAPRGELPAQPDALWDLRVFDGRLEKRDADGIWRPLWP